MKSTGEVMGISDDFGISFAKSQTAAGNKLAKSGKLFLSLADKDKDTSVALAKKFIDLGFEIVATSGTAKKLKEHELSCQNVLKISEGRPNIEDMLKNGEISMVINTSDAKSVKDDTMKIRQSVVRFNVPYLTTLPAANAAAHAIEVLKNQQEYGVKALQDYLA